MLRFDNMKYLFILNNSFFCQQLNNPNPTAWEERQNERVNVANVDRAKSHLA